MLDPEPAHDDHAMQGRIVIDHRDNPELAGLTQRREQLLPGRACAIDRHRDRRRAAGVQPVETAQDHQLAAHREREEQQTGDQRHGARGAELEAPVQPGAKHRQHGRGQPVLGHRRRIKAREPDIRRAEGQRDDQTGRGEHRVEHLALRDHLARPDLAHAQRDRQCQGQDHADKIEDQDQALLQVARNFDGVVVHGALSGTRKTGLLCRVPVVCLPEVYLTDAFKIFSDAASPPARIDTPYSITRVESIHSRRSIQDSLTALYRDTKPPAMKKTQRTEGSSR